MGRRRGRLTSGGAVPATDGKQGPHPPFGHLLLREKALPPGRKPTLGAAAPAAGSSIQKRAFRQSKGKSVRPLREKCHRPSEARFDTFPGLPPRPKLPPTIFPGDATARVGCRLPAVASPHGPQATRPSHCVPREAEDCDFLVRERALGHEPAPNGKLRCRFPGGRPGVGSRHNQTCVAFSGRQKITTRRRHGRRVTLGDETFTTGGSIQKRAFRQSKGKSVRPLREKCHRPSEARFGTFPGLPPRPKLPPTIFPGDATARVGCRLPAVAFL